MANIPYFRNRSDNRGMTSCINCGKDYNITSALIYLKGNEFFCSKECVLKYAERWENDRNGEK